MYYSHTDVIIFTYTVIQLYDQKIIKLEQLKCCFYMFSFAQLNCVKIYIINYYAQYTL